VFYLVEELHIPPESIMAMPVSRRYRLIKHHEKYLARLAEKAKRK